MIKTSAWLLVGKLLLLAIALLALYNLEILYGGSMQVSRPPSMCALQEFDLDISYILLTAGAVLFAAVLIPVGCTKPSDFFLLFYGLFVLIPFAVLHPIRGEIESTAFLLHFSIILFPALAVRATAFSPYALRFPGLISPRTMTWFVALFCFISIAVALAYAPTSASFDYASMYVRRMEGRAIYATGTLLAYLNSMTMNGFAPFLAFIAGWRYKARWFVFALVCAVIYYYLVGTKAPLLYTFLAAAVGCAVRVRKVHLLSRTLILFLLVVFAVSLIEYWCFRNSQVTNYFINRAFFVPPYIVSGYFDFMGLAPDFFQPAWTLLEGVGEHRNKVTFLVGKWLFPMVTGNNANTNTFIHKLAGGGVPLYVATILLVAGVFALLDSTYAASRNPMLIYAGAAWSILLIEQSATTALLSSGIGVIMILCSFTHFVPISSGEGIAGKVESNPKAGEIRYEN